MAGFHHGSGESILFRLGEREDMQMAMVGRVEGVRYPQRGLDQTGDGFQAVLYAEAR